MLLVIDQAENERLRLEVQRLTELQSAAMDTREDPRLAYPYSSYLPTPILVFRFLEVFTVSNPIH